MQPRSCKPDLTRVACGSANTKAYVNASNCLSDSQIVTLKAIYTSWTSNSGKFLFPTFEPGSEFGWPNTVNGVPYGPARKTISLMEPNISNYSNTLLADYFSYQVLNKTSVQ